MTRPVLLALAALACTPAVDGVCGEGTHYEDGFCVADDLEEDSPPDGDDRDNAPTTDSDSDSETDTTSDTDTVDLGRCGPLYECHYRHEHYADGSGISHHRMASMDQEQARLWALEECMDKEFFGNLSTLTESQRCELQGCEVVFDPVDCDSLGSFQVVYEHTHYSDGSGVDHTDDTAPRLEDADFTAWEECVLLEVNGRPSELMPSEICRIDEVHGF